MMVPLEEECYVSTLCAGVMVVLTSCPDVTVSVGDQEMMTDLLVLDMRDFDVILEMDWLASYHATVECFSKEVIFRIPGQPPFCLSGDVISPPIISVTQAHKLLLKGCVGYLAAVQDTQSEGPQLEDIPVVQEYPDVFPEDLPGVPPDREVEFTVDLVPDARPASRAPYRMAPSELRELKVQLQELLDKGFIRPSVSP